MKTRRWMRRLIEDQRKTIEAQQERMEGLFADSDDDEKYIDSIEKHLTRAHRKIDSMGDRLSAIQLISDPDHELLVSIGANRDRVSFTVIKGRKPADVS